MSGKNQHFIPQSLQRGFLCDAKAERTYVHRRGQAPRPSLIKHVAAQSFFYSEPSTDGTQTLDDMITHYENRLGFLLKQLRKTSMNEAVDAAIAAEVIAHLTPRSAGTRRMVHTGIHEIMTGLETAFSDEQTVSKILGLSEQEPNPVWNKHCMAALEKMPDAAAFLDKLPFPPTFVNRVLFMMTKEQFAGNYDSFSDGFTQIFLSLTNNLKDFARDGHNKALAAEMVATARKRSLEALAWHIRTAPSEGAILPDCVALGLDDGEAHFLPYIMTDTTKVTAVVMPLTSDKLLVGVRPGCDDPDLSTFNYDAASCCDELFITASNALALLNLSTSIGVRWHGTIQALADGTLNQLFPDRTSKPVVARERIPQSPIAYQLTFNGLGSNEEEIAPIGDKIQYIVSLLHDHLNLERLDGVTLSINFDDSIAAVDRGFDRDDWQERAPEIITTGAATMIVVREGMIKVRVVLDAIYGLSLVGGESQNAQLAAHVLVAALAQVDTIARIEEHVPGFLVDSVTMTDHDAVLHCAIRRALRAYRSAQFSAGIGADDLVNKQFSNCLIAALEKANQVLMAAKEQHAATPDFFQLFLKAHGVAIDILISAARLSGHWRGLDIPKTLNDDSAALRAMSDRQLAGWFHVYSRDLECFWNKRSWSLADFYSLNIHVERVLWSFGVAVWLEPSVQSTMIWVIPVSH